MSLFQSEGSCVTAPKMRGKVVILLNRLTWSSMSRNPRRKGRGSRRRGWGSWGRWRSTRWWGWGGNCPTRGRRRGWRNRL